MVLLTRAYMGIVWMVAFLVTCAFMVVVAPFTLFDNKN